MLGFFPTPHPDELFYSLCARYSDRVQYPINEDVNLDLFGIKRCAAGVHLPHHLFHFAANLPLHNYFTIDRLIDQHTLFPFYSPFIPRRRVNLIRKGMKGSSAYGVIQYSGITASSIQPYEYLRYCPQCVEEDDKEFGQHYWHRLHQVVGVLICPEHNCPTQSSTINVASLARYCDYISADRAIALNKNILPSPPKASHEFLFKLAQDVTWLLNQRGLSPGFDLIHARYIDLLISKGLTDHTGRPKYQLISKLLIEFYGRDLLKLLECQIDVGNSNAWSLRIVTDLLREKAHHPLRHLLLINFLGHTAESFFAQCSKNTQKRVSTFLNPFGKGPWPCLNPTCKFFKQNVIDKCYAKYSRTGSNRKRCIVASFSCTCGFTYCSSDVDLLTQGKFQYSFIRSYGPIWEASLSELWSGASLTLEKMAESLGVSIRGLKNQALRLGLPFPREGPTSRISHCDTKRLLKLKEKASKLRSIRAHRRSEWLAILKSHPKITLRFLRKSKGYTYYLWLLKHDQTWLNNHMPKPYKIVRRGRNFDWGARDVQLSNEVQMAVLQLKRSDDCPVRITKNLIMRMIKKESLVGSLSKLPLTAKKISEVVETREEYAVRRLYWAVAHIRKEQITPLRPALRKLGGMDDFWHTPSMKSFFDRVLEELQNAYITAEVA